MKLGMTVLAAALMLGSAAAFTWTERLKLERPPIGVPRFDNTLTPGCGCPRERARVSFLLRRRERLDVFVIDEDDHVVRTLAADLEKRPGRVELKWDGKDGRGRTVPEGDYRVRLRLERAGRTIMFPSEIRVTTGS
jgi:hypothetical protein